MAKPPAERVRASRIKAAIDKGQPIEPTELEWYEKEYLPSVNRRFTERISHTEERDIAEGDAANVDPAWMIAREEGRRIDYLMGIAIKTAMDCNSMFQQMALQNMQQNMVNQQAINELLVSVREHFLARTEIEAQMMQMGQSEIGQLMEALPMLMQMFDKMKKRKEKKDKEKADNRPAKDDGLPK